MAAEKKIVNMCTSMTMRLVRGLFSQFDGNKALSHFSTFQSQITPMLIVLNTKIFDYFVHTYNQATLAQSKMLMAQHKFFSTPFNTAPNPWGQNNTKNSGLIQLINCKTQLSRFWGTRRFLRPFSCSRSSWNVNSPYLSRRKEMGEKKTLITRRFR